MSLQAAGASLTIQPAWTPLLFMSVLSFLLPIQTATAESVYESGFEGPEALKGWQGSGRVVTGFQSPQAVGIDAGIISIPLPGDALRGGTVRATAMVRAESVSAKPNPWNGIKFMLAVETPDRKLWPQAPLDVGTFDWKRAAFAAKIPTNATSVRLCLGLEAVRGRVAFDDVRLTVSRPTPRPVPPPAAGPAFKGHDLPRLRGAMVGPHCTEDDLRVLGKDWNANLVRWQLIAHPGPGKQLTSERYDAWLESELQRLDRALPWCERYGLLVAIDLHSPPGGKGTVAGYGGSDSGLFNDRAAQDKFVALWKRMAARYKDSKAVWGYDLANEPVEDFVGEDCDDWYGLATRAARAIREIDPVRAILCEAPPWGSPDSLADFFPLPVSNVVYSVHMYVPGAFTHQNVHKKNQPPVAYPGMIEGRMWNRDALEAALKPAIDFQKKFNVHIYIGEFSAIRWAPDGSARRYLADCIDIFEKHGWDWSYHAFREWNGWSVEHGPDPADPKPAATPTDRKKLLLEWFAKNRKP